MKETIDSLVEDFKNMITIAPDPDKPFVIFTDAAYEHGLGARW